MDLIQLHLKLQTNLENKKVTEKGEYYFAKCFKDVVSCAKKNRSDLTYILHDDSFGRLISNTSHVLGFEVEYESIMPRGNGNINKETDCGNTIEQYIIYR